jgi:LPXTG-motif cell wall-anchored protein
MRGSVRAAGITSKRRTRTGVVATKVGALAFGLGLTMLAGAFFAGPALAQQGAQAPRGVVMDHEDGHGDEPPPCGDLPLPPCDDESPTPIPTDTGEPPVDPPTTQPPVTPSNVKTKPPADGGNGGGGNGGGGDQGGNSGGGGSYDNDGPQLPATGAEAGLLAGMGAALVGGGVALVVLARRRRAALAVPSGSSDDKG